MFWVASSRKPSRWNSRIQYSALDSHQVAHGPIVRRVEIYSGAPVGLVTVGEIVACKLAEVVAIRSEVVVHDIQNHSHSERVCTVDELPEIIRGAVQARRREGMNAVVTPTELAGKFTDWHHLNDRNASVTKISELCCCGRPGTFRGEGAHVHFVEYLASRVTPGQPSSVQRNVSGSMTCEVVRGLRLKT